MPRPRSDSREKLVEGARVLLRRQGYHGTGLAQIIETSGAPRGSVYFLFPGGKEEIAVAAVEASAEGIPELIRASATAPTVEGWTRSLTGYFAEQLTASGFADGCPITTIALDSVPGSEPLTRACRMAYDSWLRAIEQELIGYGVPRDAAPSLATTMLACLEGALVLCRVQQSTEPLQHITTQLLALVAVYVTEG